MKPVDPLATSAHGDAVWFRRIDCPAAEDALAQHERLEGSTPGDELLNAEGAARRVRLVWLSAEIPPHDPGEDWMSFWVVAPDGTRDGVECWEVV